MDAVGAGSQKWDVSLTPAASGLRQFDVPRELVEPLLWVFRQNNTLADALFYDVGLLGLRLMTRGITVTTSTNAQFEASARDSLAAAQAAAKFINRSAQTNPEVVVILVVDAHHAPFEGLMSPGWSHMLPPSTGDRV